MPVEVLLERKPYGLAPLTAEGEEQLAGFAIGSVLKAKITKHKSRPMLRLFWAVVDQAAEGLGMRKTELANDLLWATKRVDSFQHRRDGSLYVIPKSIARMTADEFREFVDDALTMLFSDYVTPEARHEIIRVAERRARTTYRDALRELEQEQ